MPRKQVSDEIKQEILRKHLDEGRTVKSLCDEYFLAHSTIERWITEYRKECQEKPKLKEQSEIYEENRKLRKELEELNLSSVVYIMVVKNYVITSMSIIEGLFTNIVKSNDWWKTSDLESLGTTQANETKFEDQKYIIKTELLKKVEPYNVQMNLDELIKILNRHHSALGVDHLIYPALKRLKDLRNSKMIQKF